jgi:hypothetical protein
VARVSGAIRHVMRSLPPRASTSGQPGDPGAAAHPSTVAWQHTFLAFPVASDTLLVKAASQTTQWVSTSQLIGCHNRCSTWFADAKKCHSVNHHSPSSAACSK